MKVINKILIYVFAIVLVSCNNDGKVDCFKSQGDPITIRRDLEPFHEIVIFDLMDVELVQDTIEFVELSTGSNLVTAVRTTIENGRMTIKDENYCKFVRKAGIRHKLVIHLKNLSLLDVNGGVKVKSNNTLIIDKLRILHNGVYDMNLDVQANLMAVNGFNSGGFNFKGWSSVLSLGIEVVSHFNGKDLFSDDVYVAHYSPKDVRVNVNKVFFVGIFGYGDISYKGNPHTLTIDKTFPGRGVLKKLP